MQQQARRARRAPLALAGVLLLVGSAGPAAALTAGALADGPIETIVETVDGVPDATVDTVDSVTETAVDILLGSDDPGVTIPVPPDTTVARPALPAPTPAASPAPVPELVPPVEAPVSPSLPTNPAPAEAAADDATVRLPSAAEVRADRGDTTPSGGASAVVRHAGLPLALIGLVVLFLSLQDRIDRRDPKLALAPRAGPPDLVFPAGQARA